MQPGPTRYAKSGDLHIAYSVTGDGPIDILYVPTWISHVEHLWDHPAINAFFTRLASFGRLIMFDRRGSGLSDPVTSPPTLEEQMDDVRAVMDAAGSERAGLFAQLEGGMMAMLFAASFPERTGALLLYATFARVLRSEAVHWANTAEDREAHLAPTIATWGDGSQAALIAPSMADDPTFIEWYGRLQRYAGSPGTADMTLRALGEQDVSAVLPTIRVPTLVMHRSEDPFIDRRHSEYIASLIPDSKLVIFPGNENLVLTGDWERLTDEMEEFLTGARRVRPPDRILATVLFTDIVDSTRRAADLGDRRWREVLERHDELVRLHLGRFQGREVKTTGDGFLATFDGPARAIRCAWEINEAVRRLGIGIRAGLHTGECEVRGDDVAGMAVHIGARVGSSAKPGEVLVSSTVKDLVVGSGIEFADRGTHELKGVPGEWHLYAVEGAEA